MAIRDLLKEAQDYIGAIVEEDSDCFHLTVGVTDTEDEEGEFGRTQLVSVYAGGTEEGEEIVIAFSQVGPYTDEVALPEILRNMSSAVFSRFYIGDADDDGGEPMVIEAGALAEGLTASSLAAMIQEVCDLADGFESAMFEEDDA